MDIIGMLTKAADLFDEATELYNRVKPSVESATAPPSADLQQAQERLRQSMERANAAHSSLDEAISARLGE